MGSHRVCTDCWVDCWVLQCCRAVARVGLLGFRHVVHGRVVCRQKAMQDGARPGLALGCTVQLQQARTALHVWMQG